MIEKKDKTNPIRVYAETGEKRLSLVQIVDYYNVTFRYETLPNVTATVFPNMDIAKTAVIEFKRLYPNIGAYNFVYVDVLDYGK